MALGNRSASARHEQGRTAGVVPSDYWSFAPGQRVTTIEGFPGTVTEVQDGPYPSTEVYIVTLDNDMGGGEYGADELTAFPTATAATARFLTLDDVTKIGEEVLSETAAADYPELADVLITRPPLQHSITASTKTAADGGCSACGGTGVQAFDPGDGTHYECYICDGSGTAEAEAEGRAAGTTNANPENGLPVGIDLATQAAIGSCVQCGQPVGYTGDRVAAAAKLYGGNGSWAARLCGVCFDRSMQENPPKEAVVDSQGHEVVMQSGEDWYSHPDGSISEEDGTTISDGSVVAFVDKKESGWFTDKVMAPWAENLNNHLNPEHQYHPGNTWSYDWCRFRKNSRCMYPTHINAEATSEAGYAVWVPEDRGLCPRMKWDDQKKCPVGQPGPHSGDPNALTDATVPWEQGGQHGGVVSSKEAGWGDDVRTWIGQLACGHQSQVQNFSDDAPTMMKCPKDGYQSVVSAQLAGMGMAAKLAAYYKPDGSQVTLDDMVQILVDEGIKTQEEIDNILATGKLGEQKIRQMVTEPIYKRWLKGDYQMWSGKPEDMPSEWKTAGWDEDVIISVSSVDPVITGPLDHEFRWHFTAAWKDVRAKAKRIRSEGRVRIVSAPNNGAMWVSAEVEGDTNVYQTTITHQPGHKNVAMWECGCAWASYSWGRTGRWRRYEGRMCSHALATLFEAQAQQMFGGEIAEQAEMPSYRDSTVPVLQPTNYPKPKRRASVDPSLATPPIVTHAIAMLEIGVKPNDVMESMVSLGAKNLEAIMVEALRGGPIKAKVRGWVQTVVDILSNGIIVLDSGDHVSEHEVFYPLYDPTLGLSLSDSKYGSLEFEAGDGADSTGVMIALRPPEEACDKLNEHAEEDHDQLHITLAYLGKTSDIDEDRLRVAVEAFALGSPPLTGRFGGAGAFQNEAENVLVALVDIPGIDGFVAKLNEYLDAVGIAGPNNHGLQPHLTLKYSDEPITEVPDIHALGIGDVDFDHLILAYGGDWKKYPLGGTAQKVAHLAAFEVDARFDPSEARDPSGKWTDPISPNYTEPKGNRPDNPHATEFSKMPKEWQDKITKQVAENAPDTGHGPLTMQRMSANLEDLYTDMAKRDPDLIKAGSGWYSMAKDESIKVAQEGNLSPRLGVGMMASLSPQCDWDENMTQCHYITRKLGEDKPLDLPQSTLTTVNAMIAKMVAKAKVKPVVSPLVNGIKPSDMDPLTAAYAIYAQGKYVETLKVPTKLKLNGEPYRAMWTNGMKNIAKAVRIYRGEDPNAVLSGHKVRSFFNNIADPADLHHRGDVTMDVHAVSAAAHAMISAQSKTTKKMFDTGGSTALNAHGAYAMFADSYRNALGDLKDKGIVPKDMTPSQFQAAIWLYWRNLTNAKKYPDADLSSFPRVTAAQNDDVVIEPLDPWVVPEGEHEDPDHDDEEELPEGWPYNEDDDDEGEGAEATLHDEPEPALPETDGAEEEEDQHKHGALAELQSGLEWLMKGVTRTAAKVFSPDEQRNIIDEGSDVTAANLDRLDIAGTHYEALEAALAAQDEAEDDESWLGV